MSIKINDVLTHLKSVAAGIDGMHADRVHIGPIEPTRIAGDPHIMIVLDRNKGERIDGGDIYRRPRVSIVIGMRIDPLADDPDVQINAIYEPMHAAFEQLRDGVAGVFETMVEVEDSLEYDTAVFKNQPIRFAGADWDITFERTLGETE